MRAAGAIPAQFTSTRGAPSCLAATCSAAATLSSLVTSHPIPTPFNGSATRRAAASSRLKTATRAPCPDRCRAVAAPSPDAPPVMITVVLLNNAGERHEPTGTSRMPGDLHTGVSFGSAETRRRILRSLGRRRSAQRSLTPVARRAMVFAVRSRNRTTTWSRGALQHEALLRASSSAACRLPACARCAPGWQGIWRVRSAPRVPAA